ncbi:MAG: hypothetical protein H7A35_06440 [Planctomycetales bacterium]|nr:PKD domain-containing protein [bacterium]UNM09695.1 MAG: hypothetical protein H7A35_06440 [Planctomycetales bacterium]
MRSRTHLPVLFLRLASIAAAVSIALASFSCGAARQSIDAQPQGPLMELQTQAGSSGWPEGIPQDNIQPWEELDAEGYVIPAARLASAINLESEFIPGVERFSSSGEVSDNGEASHISSAPGTTAQAMYRIPLGGGHPGVVSVDANLVSGRGYYIGLADYGSSRWQWHGPFTDNHIRISTALQGPYTSSLGSLFVSVLVHNGSYADVIGIGVNTEDPGDTTAPPQPTGLQATPVASGLLLDWDSVIAGDLAGYRIYHSDAEFSDGSQAGVSRVDSLEGMLQHQLSSPAGEQQHVRISAIDISGNESPLSDMVSAAALDGSAPKLILTVNQPNAGLSEPVFITASGAVSYDFDIDGDGSYDITGDSSGEAFVDTSRKGIIRPRVRATGTEGSAIALGTISLVVTANSRPVASATATPQNGQAPLNVGFTGLAEDVEDAAEALSYAWDLDGDGFYEPDTDTLVPGNEYFVPGIYGVKFRVTDSEGAWDVDTVPVLISSAPGNIPPVAVLRGSQFSGQDSLEVEFSAIDSYDPDGSITDYEWDFDGDGFFNEVGVEADNRGKANPPAQTYLLGPPVVVRLVVTDNQAATNTSSFTVIVHGWDIKVLDSPGTVGGDNSMAIVAGAPAISYLDQGNGDLKYVRALDENGLAWGTPIILDAAGSVGYSTSMHVVDGKPAISYYDGSNGNLKYIRALDALGETWSTPLVLDGLVDDAGQQSSLRIVNGNPAVSYRTFTNNDLRYVRALDATGDSWGTPLEVDTTDDVGRFSSLLVVDGNPAISYQDYTNANLMYVRAQDADGVSWGTPQVLDTDLAGSYTSLLVVDGYPAISFVGSAGARLKYIRALDVTGSSWGAAITIDATSGTGEGNSIAILDGFPAVSYLSYTDYDLKLVRALDASGSSWGTPEDVDTDGSVGRYSDLLVINGKPAISYQHSGDTDLKYAKLY